MLGPQPKEIYKKYVKNIQKKMAKNKYAKNMPRTRQKYASNMQKQYAKNARNIQKQYARIMQVLCKIIFKNIAQTICQKHARMCKKYAEYAKINAQIRSTVCKKNCKKYAEGLTNKQQVQCAEYAKICKNMQKICKICSLCKSCHQIGTNMQNMHQGLC